MITIRAVLVVAAVASVSEARNPTVSGKVSAARARWSGDVIVTESEIRGPTGEVTRVVQLGGVVDGIGMSLSHQPEVLHEGDEVTLEIVTRATVAGTNALVVIDAQKVAATSVTGGTATYGVQRTSRSKAPLWRDTACLATISDTDSVSDEMSRVLDDAFESWTAATSACRELTFTSTRHAVTASSRDGYNTVQLRTDRWCRPATQLEPELCYAPDAAAVTRLTFVDDPSSVDDGRILDADMEINGVGLALLPGVDLQSVATHEAGHVLGLAHNCGTEREAWPSDHAGNPVPSCAELLPGSVQVAATMYYRIEPGQTHARTVEASDAAGSCAMSDDLACVQQVSGGCSAGRGTASLWGVLAILVAVGYRRRRRRVS